MKNTFKFATAAVLTAIVLCTSTSCTKEQIIDNTSLTIANTPVTYIIDGQEHHSSPTNDEEWTILFDHLFALAQEGYTVTIWTHAASVTTAKEKVTYTTTNKTDAQKWCEKKLKEGYTTTITYDSEMGCYVCIAVK